MYAKKKDEDEDDDGWSTLMIMSRLELESVGLYGKGGHRELTKVY